MFDYNYLLQLIANRLEENSELEYKAAGALQKDDKKVMEITKDISSFGKMYAKYINIVLSLPERCMDDRAADEDNSRTMFHIDEINRLKPYGPARYEPLLPGMHVNLYSFDLTPQALEPGNKLSWTIYADNAEPQSGSIEFSAIDRS
jgi:hypothetical protein